MRLDRRRRGPARPGSCRPSRDARLRLLAGAALLAATHVPPVFVQLRLAPPAFAQGAVPVPPPLPPERPAEFAPPTPPAGPPLAGAPAPPERPAGLVPGAAETSPAAGAAPPTGPSEPAAQATVPVPPPVPPERPPELSGQAALALTVQAPDDTACRARLKRLGAAFEPLPAIQDGQCGAPLPLKVTALADGLSLSEPVTLVCPAAEALARWATEAQAAAERELKTPLRGLRIGGSYVCRGQNHDVDAKLSEHAFADAVDVSGFLFGERAAITVGPMPEGSAEGRFLDAARARACAMFRTVLGPGSSPTHADHFHMDERERSGGHRLCQ